MALEMDGSTIVSRARDGSVDWSVTVSDLILIAEWTTDHGPWDHDWFAVFVSIEAGKPSFAVAPTDGLEAVLDKLSRNFGANISTGLANSTGWNSNILWPPSLAGQQYYTFTPVTSGNVLQRLWARFRRQREYTVSSVVWQYVDHAVKERLQG